MQRKRRAAQNGNGKWGAQRRERKKEERWMQDGHSLGLTEHFISIPRSWSPSVQIVNLSGVEEIMKFSMNPVNKKKESQRWSRKNESQSRGFLFLLSSFLSTLVHESSNSDLP